jgi:hypothetical protein
MTPVTMKPRENKQKISSYHIDKDLIVKNREGGTYLPEYIESKWHTDGGKGWE